MDVQAQLTAVAAASRVTSPKQLAATPYAPGAIDPPFAYPSAVDATRHEDLDGSSSLVVTWRILTSTAEDRSGQELLAAYLSSVPDAIEASVPGATVAGFSDPRMYEHAGTDYYGAECQVVILA